jgi:parvulin-like peptidyl-prolyl isomerase
MVGVLQLNDFTINAEDLIPLLTRYQILPQLLCEWIIDQAIAPIQCTPEEIAQSCAEFDQHWRLKSEIEKQMWRSQYGLTPSQLEQLATRKIRVEKFKEASWGQQIESYFLKRKAHLDQVIYSILRVQNQDLANELFFRIQEGEEAFAELARRHSEGNERDTGGLIGPVEFSSLSGEFSRLLYVLPEGEVHPPIPFGEWQVIVRVEKRIPARLDAAMRQRLLHEKFENWFQEQIRQLSPMEQTWMGVKAELAQAA